VLEKYNAEYLNEREKMQQETREKGIMRSFIIFTLHKMSL
jgi:hypothetical protein